eukprot:6180722-Pleurochrysis_carterae.AAC.2
MQQTAPFAQASCIQQHSWCICRTRETGGATLPMRTGIAILLLSVDIAILQDIRIALALLLTNAEAAQLLLHAGVTLLLIRATAILLLRDAVAAVLLINVAPALIVRYTHNALVPWNIVAALLLLSLTAVGHHHLLQHIPQSAACVQLRQDESSSLLSRRNQRRSKSVQLSLSQNAVPGTKFI